MDSWMKKILPLFLFLTLNLSLSAQDPESLERIARDTTNLDVKTELWSRLTHYYDSVGDHRKTIEMAKTLLRISQIRGHDDKIASAYLHLAKNYYEMGNLEEALVYFKLLSIQSQAMISNEANREVLNQKTFHELEKKAFEKDVTELSDNLRDTRADLRESEFARRKYLVYIIALGLISIGSLGYLIYFRSRKTKEIQEEVEGTQKELDETVTELRDQQDTVYSKNQLIKDLNHELAMSSVQAKRMQLSMLPDQKAFNKAFPESVIFYRPKDVVSGDTYWLGTSDEKTILIILDTNQNGLPGAFQTFYLTEELEMIIQGGKITAPNMILTLLDQKLKQMQADLEEKDHSWGLEMAVCIFDKEKKNLEYAGAKIPLYIFHNNRLKTLKGNRLPVGNPLFQEKFYSSETVKLYKGDMIYLTTDGFEDQMGGIHQNKFMRPALRKLLKSIQNQKISEQTFVIEKVFSDWKGSRQQTDDILLLGLRV